MRFKAKCFIDGLLKYETILTAHIFQEIFVYITPLSLYLQTKGMNVVHAFSMVKTTISTLQSKARDYNHIKDLTKTFIE